MRKSGKLLDRLDVGGDVLALGAVAARGGHRQSAVLVKRRERQSVDFRLDGHLHFGLLPEIEKAPDPGVEFAHVLGRERVVQGQHRHRMFDLAEPAGRRRAHAFRRTIRAHQLGKAFFDRVVALFEGVVGRIGNHRRIGLMISRIMGGDLGGEGGQLRLGLIASVSLATAMSRGASEVAARLVIDAAIIYGPLPCFRGEEGTHLSEARMGR